VFKGKNMIGIIAAVTSNGVIGIDNKLPFNYPADLKHFKQTTENSTVIMGKNTFISIGKPLPKRHNIVISSSLDNKNINRYTSLHDALLNVKTSDAWLIGGASIYEEGMQFADKIILTISPDIELHKNAIRFPWINPRKFAIKKTQILDLKSNLYVITYEKHELMLSVDSN
jgi:dihydrofolate reductase